MVPCAHVGALNLTEEKTRRCLPHRLVRDYTCHDRVASITVLGVLSLPEPSP